jgi:hypothetical protein
VSGFKLYLVDNLTKGEEEMREHLYKAISKETGEWVEGDLVHGIEQVYIKALVFGNMVCSVPTAVLKDVPVDPATVCEFTGLKDSKGVRIFEMDILNNNWHVKWSTFGKWLAIKEYSDIEKCDIYQLGDMACISEITGNIHNKENQK